MIVPMKKVTVLCLDADRDRTLERLQAAGVLHLEPVTPPAGADLDARRSDLDSARKALALLDAEPAAAAGANAPAVPDATAIAGQVLALAARRRELSETMCELQRERTSAALFGDFDPAALRQLADAGVRVAFFLDHGTGFTPPPGTAWSRLGTDSSGTLYAVAGAAGASDGAVEVAPPERPIGVVNRDLREAEAASAALRLQMAGLATARTALAAHARRIEDDVAFLEARTGMGAAGRIAYLHGFCPADLVPALEVEARAAGWGLQAAEPDPGDRVPVLIRPPAWAQPIACLLRFIKILPGYHEADVSGSFLVFLSLFFAMIIGDAGYGAIFLALTALARKKMPRATSEPFVLMTIFSVCTVVWGVVTGVYFGITTALPGPLQALRIDWLSDTQNIMSLCLLLGAIHLSVAHTWNVVRMINSPQAIAQAGWLAIVWTMYFAGRMLLLNQPFPMWYTPVAAAGLLAVIVFMTPPAKLKADWINHAMLPLTLMSNFGDILSYLRLFALGVASVQLASAFNKIAVESIGFHGPLSGFVAAALLFVGHAVNIVLSGMSVLVHGIRLNALEFSMHMGLEWSGTQYVPFSRRGSQTAG
jgi:V/A-type H+-transporting ATPase subunit I